jgi:hypothetical protein
MGRKKFGTGFVINKVFSLVLLKYCVMKKFIISSVLLALFITCTTKAQVQQEEYLGLPGDNLNLYAVMKLFQESETLEGFERSLNDENSRINNLDLNGDNYVDYIKVLDYADGDVHNIVLQVPVNSKENQDVAVFTVQKYANGQVQIQLTGDEALYGKNYIIEPIIDEAYNGETPNPGYTGNSEIIYGRNVRVIRTTTYEIANWPLIRFIYLPTYVVWRSSWYWDYYPYYWNPWRPFYWHYYYGYHYNWYNHYYGHYRRWNYHRYPNWNNFYYSSRRSHSPNVSYRINTGSYRNTYSRPDQRRAGEAMYTKMYAEQNTRRTNNSSGMSPARRSATQSTPVRNYTSNNTSRRTTTGVTNRSVTNPQPGQNSGTERRSTTTVTNKPVVKTQSGQISGTARRSTATLTNKPVAKAQSTENAGTTRRSTATVTNKPVIKAQSTQNAGTTRRSTATETNKPVVKAQSGLIAGTARRASAPVTYKPAARASSTQKATTTSRSSSPVTYSRAAKAPARQSAATPRSSGRSASAGMSSSGRNSSGSRSVSTGSKGGNTKSSGTSRSSRR